MRDCSSRIAAPNAARSRSATAGSAFMRTSRHRCAASCSGNGGSEAKAAPSSGPCTPRRAGSSSRMTRHGSGKARRLTTGGVRVAAPRPPSRMSPPRSNTPMPMPERPPRPSRRASPARSGGRSWSLRIAAATASASCVPEPRPTCAGTVCSMSTVYAPLSPRCRRIVSRCCSTRARSGPATRAATAVQMRIRVPNCASASPMLANRRPKPPPGSRKPKCRRAGAWTVTQAAVCPGLPGMDSPAVLPPNGFDRMRRQALQAIVRANWQRSIPMNEVKKERTYSDAEVEARLKQELPHWHLEGGWIRRRYRTHSWKGTLMVINAVGHLAEAAWHHPDITASYAWVEVRLQNHAAKGITDKDFELAKKIEEVVHWQPGKQGGALEGTPEKDQSFAYVKYDA